MAARAEPERGWERGRARRASRTAIGACRPTLASVVRNSGDSRITAAMRATKPRTSSGAPPPLLLWPVYQNRNAATTSRTRPGTAERWTRFGGAGRPDRAATMGSLVIDRAGREAAEKGAKRGRAR